jgi:predicted  nucleic acid-binding Zn-ribbon protein
MATKLLGVQALEMYEKMIKKEFQPIIDILEARGNSIRQKAVQQAKTKFGVYELEAKIKTMDIRLQELKDELGNLVGHYQYLSDNSIVGKEISKIMDQLNHPLAEVRNKRDKSIKQLRLSGLPNEIQEVFKELDNTILKLTDDVKKLPPITKVVKQIGRKKII